jgi:hypothetical protein
MGRGREGAQRNGLARAPPRQLGHAMRLGWRASPFLSRTCMRDDWNTLRQVTRRPPCGMALALSWTI